MAKKNQTDLSFASTDQLLAELAKRCDSMAFIGFFPNTGGSSKFRTRIMPTGSVANAMGLCDMLKSQLLRAAMNALTNAEPAGDDDDAEA